MPRTIPNVEIARVGTYKLSTGEHTFTRAQLAAAIRNAAARFKPRLGIGHIDQRFNASGADGEPAIGTVANLRLGDDGDTLIGDYVNVPDWLALALPSAYPGRSIEGDCDGDDLRVDCVKLLGTQKPGIDTLQDLEAFVSDRGPAVMASGPDNEGRQIVVFLAATGATPDAPTAASRPDTSKERNHMDEAVRKVLAAANGLDPATATEEQVNAAIIANAEVASKASADETAAKLAADDQAKAAAEAAAKAAEVEPVVPEPVVETPELEPIAAAAQQQITTLSAEVASLQADKATREQADTAKRRDLKASAWVAQGRITNAERDGLYRPLLDIDEDRVSKQVEAMAPGRVPVTASAAAVTADTDEITSTGWFPQLATTKES